MYEETPENDADVLAIRACFAEAQKIMEPTFDDLTRCCRMGAAMLRLLRERDAAGMAIACFDLIRRCGVNPCLGVSYINGETEYVASCEGDTDSAVTMRMIRALGGDSPFMANPCLRPDGTVNFAHCTAPVRIRGERQRFWLYNHHETGVGASVRVFYEPGQRWTMVRYSGVENVLTVQGCTAVEGRYEPNCRTQLCVLPDDRKRYLDTLLGCHQVLVCGDWVEDIRAFAEFMKMGVR
jgi:L-fucose isomerase-like protein